MSTGRELAAAFLSLEKTQDRMFNLVFDHGYDVSRHCRRINELLADLPAPDPRVLAIVFEARARAKDVLRDTSVTISDAIGVDLAKLRANLWLQQAATDGPAGYIRPIPAGGEPLIPSSAHYEPTPLTMPAVIDIDLARQGRKKCYFVVAINALAHRRPDLLDGVVRQDGDEVVVTVWGGTYRMPATLPVDTKTGSPVYSTSPDGSTMVAYLEKAAAMHFGSYLELEMGSSGPAMLWIVGDSVPSVAHRNASTLTEAELLEILPRVEPAYFSVAPARKDGTQVPADLLDRLDLSTNHAYTIESVGADGHVVLRDQQLTEQPARLSPADLRELDAEIGWLDLSTEVRRPPDEDLALAG